MDFTQYAVIGGAIAVITSTWQYLRLIGSKLASVLVVTLTLESKASESMIIYLEREFSRLKLGQRTYTGGLFRVKSLGKVVVIAWEILDQMGAVYYKDRKFVLLLRRRQNKEEGNGWISVYPRVATVMFLRGSWNPDSLVKEAVDYVNAIRDEERQEKRHYVKRIFGANKKMVSQMMRRNDEGEPVDEGWDSSEYRSASPIGFDRSDIGTLDNLLILDSLALNEQAREAVDEARRWKKSERWYREHGVTWQRGWLLYGEPGNGKTALARSIAEELDLPIYIYDLPSLANDELQLAWQDMLSNTPCMSLVEDIHAVFDGEKNISGGDLSFDCLINCIGGIERADGLFIVITTNEYWSISPALSRPGRLDRKIEMTRPDTFGRLKIANRILADWPNEVQLIVRSGEKDTGAEFEWRCVQRAMELFWGASDSSNGVENGQRHNKESSMVV